jgi:hypothetical protein
LLNFKKSESKKPKPNSNFETKNSISHLSFSFQTPLLFLHHSLNQAPKLLHPLFLFLPQLLQLLDFRFQPLPSVPSAFLDPLHRAQLTQVAVLSVGQFVDTLLVEVKQLQLREDRVQFGQEGSLREKKGLDFGQFVASRQVVLVVLFFVYAPGED